jgi:hypothetical protein
LQRFGFASLQVGLPALGRVGWIHSRLQVRLLAEVAPAFVVIRRALAVFELPHRRIGVLPAFGDLDDARGLVGPDVVADDDVGSVRFVACQRDSDRSLPGGDPGIAAALATLGFRRSD